MIKFVELEINKHFYKRVAKLFKLTPKEQKLVILLACLLVLGIVLRFTLPGEEETGIRFASENEEKNDENGDVLPVEKQLIIIHVTGAVEAPGVYILEEGARVFEAVEKAGGHTGDADLERINLAEPLYDGQPLYVPRKSDEVLPPSAGFTYFQGNSIAGRGGRININTAGKTELETLPGIGAVKAQSIIDFREKNGPFSSIDDLVKVTGIGEKTLEGLKELITVY